MSSQRRSDPLRPLEAAAYAVSQGLRVGAYYGQYWLTNRMTKPVEGSRKLAGPGIDAILKDLRGLLARDWVNIREGRYRAPHDMVTAPVKAIAQARRYFRDLPRVERRRHARANSEVLDDARRGRYPRYYLQNFHYQTDGWLSDESARLYDHQVEVLFVGGTDAMRRQLLVPLGEFLRDRRTAETRLVDIGAGTGRLLRMVKENYPRLNVTALDLSPNYLARAVRNLSAWRGIETRQAPAEATGLPDASQDVVTCTYLFHELPRKVRRQVAQEAFRILRPGGRLLFMDSIQIGDYPPYDGLLDYFPEAFHEPYYADFVRQDLDALFTGCGLRVAAVERHYFSRLMVLDKPA